MKKIILGLSLLLMLIENSFAETDAEYDKAIINATSSLNKQMYHCLKSTFNHPNTSNPDVCMKVLDIAKEDNVKLSKDDISEIYLKSALLYYSSKQDYISAYKYFMKSAKLGNTVAQGNLDVVCRDHSWVCK